MLQSEDVLLKRFVVNGDEEAFSELARRHAAMVYGTCVRILEDSNQAADAAQETFFQLLRDAKNISGSVPAWLHKVAANKAVDMIRKNSARRKRELQYTADKPRKVEKWDEISQSIDEELNELDQQTKELLLRHYFEGQSPAQIAEVMGVSSKTIYRRIESAVDQLRERLSRKGMIVTAAGFISLLAENALQAAPAIVLKEICKMSLIGGASAITAGQAAAGTGAKAIITSTIAGIKANAVTVAVVTVVGVGSVMTYNHAVKEFQEPIREPVSSFHQSLTVEKSSPKPPPAKSVIIESEPVKEQPIEPSFPEEDYSYKQMLDELDKEKIEEVTPPADIASPDITDDAGYYYATSSRRTSEPNEPKQDTRVRSRVSRRQSPK